MFITFAEQNQIKNMRKPTKERAKKEQELLYLLRLYNELKGREGVATILATIEMEIIHLVELLKVL